MRLLTTLSQIILAATILAAPGCGNEDHETRSASTGDSSDAPADTNSSAAVDQDEGEDDAAITAMEAQLDEDDKNDDAIFGTSDPTALGAHAKISHIQWLSNRYDACQMQHAGKFNRFLQILRSGQMTRAQLRPIIRNRCYVKRYFQIKGYPSIGHKPLNRFSRRLNGGVDRVTVKRQIRRTIKRWQCHQQTGTYYAPTVLAPVYAPAEHQDDDIDDDFDFTDDGDLDSDEE